MKRAFAGSLAVAVGMAWIGRACTGSDFSNPEAPEAGVVVIVFDSGAPTAKGARSCLVAIDPSAFCIDETEVTQADYEVF